MTFEINRVSYSLEELAEDSGILLTSGYRVFKIHPERNGTVYRPTFDLCKCCPFGEEETKHYVKMLRKGPLEFIGVCSIAFLDELFKRFEFSPDDVTPMLEILSGATGGRVPSSEGVDSWLTVIKRLLIVHFRDTDEHHHIVFQDRDDGHSTTDVLLRETSNRVLQDKLHAREITALRKEITALKREITDYKAQEIVKATGLIPDLARMVAEKDKVPPAVDKPAADPPQ